MTIVVLDEAEADLDEALTYYESQSPGLGERFLGEFLKALQRIDDFPESYAKVYKNIRLCPIRRFPYGVFYTAGETTVFVEAVIFLKRNPRYWRRRF